MRLGLALPEFESALARTLHRRGGGSEIRSDYANAHDWRRFSDH
jgi:hypothetical protein